MEHAKKLAITVAVVSGIVLPAWAQRMGMGQAPQIPGLFKPEVGAGAQYQITDRNQKMEWAYAVVGKESVGDSEGYWLEMRVAGGEQGGMVMKVLTVTGDGNAEIKRMIMQAPGQQPMEMPLGMMGGMMQRGKQTTPKKVEELGEKVGTETVTVPAGTFVCDHYRTKHDDSPADIWISTKVSPYGLVKLTSAHTTMVLEKVLTKETSQIKGEPRKLEIPKF